MNDIETKEPRIPKYELAIEYHISDKQTKKKTFRNLLSCHEDGTLIRFERYQSKQDFTFLESPKKEVKVSVSAGFITGLVNINNVIWYEIKELTQNEP